MKTLSSIYTQSETLSNKNSIFVEKIIERYKDVHNLKSNKQVAERMGISETAFSNQKTRGSLDLEKIITSCDEDVNLHWLLTGDGNKKLSSLEKQFDELEASANDLRNADIPRDQTIEFLANQQERVLGFLRKIKKDREN